MRILITGGTNGMGKGVAQVLAKIDNQMHEIIILGRSRSIGAKVVEELQSSTLNKNISFIHCDLSKLADVKKTIVEINSTYTFLDGIFINAGLGYAQRRVETEDGMDSHFQVNYLSQFMLTLNLLKLLENSTEGGRVVFNATKFGKIHWDDMQLKKEWSFEEAIFQGMTAKRMFLYTLDRIMKESNISSIGFSIPKTVWSNQLTIIPLHMKIMAMVAKLFGQFISIEQCGEIIAPLFTQNKESILKKSGKLLTWDKKEFVAIEEETEVLNKESQDMLWKASIELCNDIKTTQIANEVFKSYNNR